MHPGLNLRTIVSGIEHKNLNIYIYIYNIYIFINEPNYLNDKGVWQHICHHHR